MPINHPLSEKLICGCDEAGRGPLAGPVVAGAVILPKGFSHPLLNDSKQLSEKHRNELRSVIEDAALAFGVGILDQTEIDEINILNASFKAMHLAIDQMKLKPEFIIVDGNRFKPYKEVPFECVVKGDSKFNEIAAASILAKTYRDEIMQQLHEEYPAYHWNKNKGYPTVKHREAIRQHGPSPYHRRSFKLLKDEQLKMF
ncbi:MAG: ribonuclease HII [Bacteroidetes bacterium]|nr:ribonuclease HII [Bacteroidota bacterium]